MYSWFICGYFIIYLRLIYFRIYLFKGAGIAQSVSRLATDWTSEGSSLSPYRVVQIGSEAYPASYPMGTGGYFSVGKAAGASSWPLASS
jgi:hypothetical protein